MSKSSAEHWSHVYSAKASDSVSWYQEDPYVSRTLIEQSASPPASVLDVGGGTSYLADRLLERGYGVGVLDISDEPLKIVRERLGAVAAQAEWFVADVTTFRSPHAWDIWHDRAVFHFLVLAEDRRAYCEALVAATEPGSTVIIATFGPAGPERCSGLPIARYSPEQLAAELGRRYELRSVEWEMHRTPTAATQQFVYCRFQRID
jgi:2-polyprenyl-3-methyl-5-hydroxy-6-metoxy-1,4-benzoquinol methylase